MSSPAQRSGLHPHAWILNDYPSCFGFLQNKLEASLARIALPSLHICLKAVKDSKALLPSTFVLPPYMHSASKSSKATIVEYIIRHFICLRPLLRNLQAEGMTALVVKSFPVPVFPVRSLHSNCMHLLSTVYTTPIISAFEACGRSPVPVPTSDLTMLPPTQLFPLPFVQQVISLACIPLSRLQAVLRSVSKTVRLSYNYKSRRSCAQALLLHVLHSFYFLDSGSDTTLFMYHLSAFPTQDLPFSKNAAILNILRLDYSHEVIEILCSIRIVLLLIRLLNRRRSRALLFSPGPG